MALTSLRCCLLNSLQMVGMGGQAVTSQAWRNRLSRTMRTGTVSLHNCLYHDHQKSLKNLNPDMAHQRRCHNSGSSKFPSSIDIESYKKAKYTRIFKLPGIVFVRALSKLKIYQTGLTFILAPTMITMHAMELVTLYSAYTAVGVNIFACGMLYLMNGFTKRVVGTISLSDDHQVACISHMNFWGNRVNTYVPVEQIMPLTDSPGKLSDIYFRVLLYDSDQYFYMNLTYARIENMELFQKTMGIIQL